MFYKLFIYFKYIKFFNFEIKIEWYKVRNTGIYLLITINIKKGYPYVIVKEADFRNKIIKNKNVAQMMYQYNHLLLIFTLAIIVELLLGHLV